MSGKLRAIPSDAIKFHVPCVQQPHNYKCGPAVTQAIIAELGVGPLEDVEYQLQKLCDLLGTSVDTGTYYGNMAIYLSNVGPLSAYVTQHISKDELQQLILEGVGPRRTRLIVSLQAYPPDKDTSVFDNPDHNKDGHYAIPVGFDSNDYFYFMDPTKVGCYAHLHWTDLDKRWHESEDDHGLEISHHLAIITRLNPLYFPFIHPTHSIEME